MIKKKCTDYITSDLYPQVPILFALVALKDLS